jgi:hypothetical protein
MFYDLLGRVTFIFIIVSSFLFLLSLLLGAILIKKRRILLPRLLLFTVDNFYHQYKKITHVFGIRETVVDQIGIELRNTLSAKAFASVNPNDRILVVPQCVRHPKCPARLDSSRGILCKECGLCIIKELKSEAETLGYRFFAVPGGRFVERIVKRVKPKAALGVACYKDLNNAMHDLSRARFIVQGVPLVRDGCVGTEVNLRELLERMRLGIEETVKLPSPCGDSGHKLSV